MPKQLILTLNAAEKRIQFLFSNEQGILYAEDFAPKKGGTDLLVSSIHGACKKLALTCQDITHIACVAGPGNFMGIRLSAVTAAGIARALENTSDRNLEEALGEGTAQGLAQGITEGTAKKNAPCLQAPLDYLQCIAANIPAKSGETVRVLTSATKNYVHCCDYTFDENGIPQQNYPIRLIPIPTSPSSQVMHDKLQTDAANISTVNATNYAINIENDNAAINAINNQTTVSKSNQIITDTPTKNEKSNENDNATDTVYPQYVVGSGLSAHKEYFQTALPTSVHFVSESFDNPSIDALYRMTVQANWQKEDIIPVYLKECDALQNLDSIATQQGRNPQEAHAELKRLMNLHSA